ncbi:ImmA/IrrE family metallo-endopeptidase [Pseudonocardia sp. ICBG1142]|uniref:ImmA/IrrE family metallo-endopeptidase n=1 Tax=Pseudonocardia sp. ICBG1142 TaxID=2846760 RepID=UPI001CF6406F|nr:ImmA/IrrE family metallo-endopeptidase [Pseudonocardia sp. ICBG1142]
MVFPLDIDEFCQKFAVHRGRPISILELCLPSSDVFGLWLESADSDVIVHDANLPPRQRVKTILHECGHMALDHKPDNGDEDLVRMIAPHLPPGMVWRRCLRRDCFDSPQENDAEHFAAVLQYWGYAADAERRQKISGPGFGDAVDIF